MQRFFYFLALFGYLNILCYEVKYCTLFDSTPIAASDTLLEVVLDDILNLEHNQEDKGLPKIMFDDYRILALFLGLVPLFFYFSWLLRWFFVVNEKVKHAIYFVKRLILPEYYTFLYRFRPF